MKIIHIAPSFKTSRIYGSGIYEVLSNLCIEQIKLGHFSKILSIGNYLCNKNTIEYTTVKTFKNQINKYKPDVVIFHSFYKWQYIIFSNYLVKKGIPYCIEFHGGVSKDNHKKSYIKKSVADFLFFDNFIRNAKKHIYLNLDEYKKSIYKNINSNYSIIPNGINLPNTFEKTINPHINILYLGRIDYKHKGIDLLIEALKKLKNEYEEIFEEIRINIVGNGNDINQLKNDIAPFGKFVTYLGAKFDNEKADIFKKSDIYILTSRYEGMPISVLEALSYGCPCIVTPETNMSEIIKNNNAGWITTTNTIMIAKTIEKAINDFSLNREIYINNARNCVKDFSWKNIASLSIEEYLK
ncbi:MAG TPA: hypothetical protein DER56_02195 [Thermosipho africanus]|nr:hypothetical protein [Thermosipho africanus]